MHNIMSDRYEEIYREGYEIGLTGVRTKCPDHLFTDPDHGDRDEWVRGYKAGRNEYLRSYEDLRGWQGDMAHRSELWGTLWVEHKEGVIDIRDCEGGTLLVQVKTIGEAVVSVALQECTAEMAHFLGRAVSKAAAIAYKVNLSKAAKLID